MDTYIKRPMETFKGTVNGVPFVHVGVSLLSQPELQSQVDEFVDDYGIHICANDFNSNSDLGVLQTNLVHDLFQVRFLKPVILVINCVSNSTSHPQWTLLVNDGGGPADWTLALQQWQAAIDSVGAAPPRLTLGTNGPGAFQFAFPGQRGRTNRIECSTNLMDWVVVTNAPRVNGPVTYRDTNALAHPRRFYRVRR